MLIDRTLGRCEINRQQIIRMAEEITLEYRNIAGGLASLGISTKIVYEEIIYPKFETKLIEHQELGRDENNCEILGQYDALTNQLFLRPLWRNDPRGVFTFWHEIGHVVLHGEWIRRLIQRGMHQGLIRTNEVSLSSQTLNELEIQANIFAGHAAAPTWLIMQTFIRVFGTTPFTFTGPGTYSFCPRHETINRSVESYSHLCWLIAGYLNGYFAGLSQEALGYRIEGASVAVDRTATPNFPKINRVARKPPHRHYVPLAH